MRSPVNIFWFRRDLRLDDNAGLYHALKAGRPVVPVFVFDRTILDQLEEKADRRVEFIRAALVDMQEQLEKLGSTLQVFYGRPKEMFTELLEAYTVEAVFTNHDYEPYATERDDMVRKMLQQQGVGFHTYKDQVIFEKSEVVKDDEKPYTVFTPYSRRWKATLTDFYLKSYPTKKYWKHFYQHAPRRIPSLSAMGFKEVDKPFPSKSMKEDLIKHYGDTRDFPALQGTSRLGVHLRFGTISIRNWRRRLPG